MFMLMMLIIHLFLVVNVKRGFRKQIISPNTHSLAKYQHNPSYFPTIRFFFCFFCFTRLKEMGFLDGAPLISGGVVGGDWARQAKDGQTQTLGVVWGKGCVGN